MSCFRKPGIYNESQETAIAEDDDPFRELQDEIDDLRSVQPNLIEEDFDATTFADVDAEVIAVQPPPSDAEIATELLETEGVSDDDDDYTREVADKPVKCPDKNELLQVIETLQRFPLFLDKGDIIQSYASRTENQVDQHFEDLRISQKHKNLDILRPKHFFSPNKKFINYIKDYFMTKNSFVGEVIFNSIIPRRISNRGSGMGTQIFNLNFSEQICKKTLDQTGKCFLSHF